MTSGGVFTGGGGVEYRWKSHRRRLQVTDQPLNYITDNTHRMNLARAGRR